MAAKRKTVEARMYDLKQATQELVGDELLTAIKHALNERESLIVEMAARAVVDLEPGDCREELLAAYRRFLIEPGESPDKDKNCRAKLPLVEALNRQRFDDPEFYLEGMKYVQMEPVYGAPSGYEDTAVHVRGACAYGLIDVPLASQNEMLFALVDLLNDKQYPAREHAARALGSTGLMAAAPVLRMKVLTGDSRIEVIGACLSGLMQYRDSHSLEFVSKFLSNKTPNLAVEAGLALAESRSEEAVRRLIAAADKLHSDIRQPLLMSVGLSRLPIAVDYLVNLIEKNGHDAATAVQALSPSRFDMATKDRVREAVDSSGRRDLAKAFREHFA
ncbi:MAG: HEAT repeat domain-containing protein [Planctomycetaceae bacterium]